MYGAASAALANGNTAPAVSGGVTYRFNRALGFGVEFARHFDAPADEASVYGCCDNDWSVTSFTTNVRVEVPTTSPRVIPFVVAGGGVAAVTRSYGPVYFADLANVASRSISTIGIDLILPGPPSYEYTTTSMALTLGGGASVMLTRHAAIDIDLRAVHLLQDGTDGGATIGRFGVGLSYRF